MSIAGALAYGLANLFHPRMLWLMVWPMLVSLLVWGTVALALWTRTAVWLAGVLSNWLDAASAFIEIDFTGVALVASHVLLFLLFVPAVYLTALFILGMFGMQHIVEHVATRFPGLERRRGGSVAGSVGNGLAALGGMAALFALSIPLWFIPPLWPLIPLAIFAWGNQRLLRYDAVSEHADAGEMQALFRERRPSLYLMGLLLALAAYVPLVGFAAPVVFGLAFIRYLLGALEERRRLSPPPAATALAP